MRETENDRERQRQTDYLAPITGDNSYWLKVIKIAVDASMRSKSQIQC